LLAASRRLAGELALAGPIVRPLRRPFQRLHGLLLRPCHRPLVRFLAFPWCAHVGSRTELLLVARSMHRGSAMAKYRIFVYVLLGVVVPIYTALRIAKEIIEFGAFQWAVSGMELVYTIAILGGPAPPPGLFPLTGGSGTTYHMISFAHWVR